MTDKIAKYLTDNKPLGRIVGLNEAAGAADTA
jgi:hypothetical protein